MPLDGTSRTIWRERGGKLVALIRFEECEALRVLGQGSLQDGRDEHRYAIEVDTTSGETFVLGDDLVPVVVTQVGQMLGLSPRRIAWRDESRTVVNALALRSRRVIVSAR